MFYSFPIAELQRCSSALVVYHYTTIIMNEVMKTDKKSLPLSNPIAAGSALVGCLAFFPIWLTVCLPLALISQPLAFMSNRLTQQNSNSSRRNTATTTATEESKSTATAETQPASAPSSSRAFHLVLFGATGFTGKLAAKYIAKQYGNSSNSSADFKWAIAGRRRDALEALRRELVEIDVSLSTLEIIIADSSDVQSLSNMAASCKVVISTAGPFGKYGSDLVKCCAALGTHYCDITGETDWVRAKL